MNSPCPDLSLLVQFLDCQLDDQQTDFLIQHLHNCKPCLEKIGSMEQVWTQSKPIDSMLDRLQSPSLYSSINQPLKKKPDISPLRESQSPFFEKNIGDIPSTEREIGSTEFDKDRLPSIPGLSDLKYLGGGGMGLVYRAFEPSLKRFVVVKIIGGKGKLAPNVQERTIREGIMLAQIHHPNVVQIYHAGLLNDQPYLVMEWIPGGNLETWMETARPSPHQSARIVRDLASAVAAIHDKGIIHRDIKPSNILVDMAENKAGSSIVVKLADFGLALNRLTNDKNLTISGFVVGTPSYMAPEQTGMQKAPLGVGPFTDIHGLGVVLYFLLTGQPPYSYSSTMESLVQAASGNYSPISAIRKGIPRDLQTIVDKCMQREPGRRYQSAADVMQELDRFLQGQPIQARPISRLETLERLIRKKPKSAIFSLMALLMTISLLLGFAFYLKKVSHYKDQYVKKNKENDSRKESEKKTLDLLNSKKIIEMVGHGPAMNEIDRQFLNSVKKRYQDWTISADDPLTDLLFRAHGISQIGERFIEIHQAGEFLACSEEALNDLKNAEQWELTPEDQEKLADIRYEILGKKSHALIENGKREKNDKKRDDYFQESIIICRNCLKELQQKTDEDDALFNRQMQFYDILSRAFLELGQKEECFQVCMEGFEFAKKISPSRHLKIQKTRLTLIYNCALRAFTSNKKDEGRLLFIELKQICQEGLEYLLSDKNLLKTDESYLEAREVFFKNHHLALHGLYYLCIDRNDEKNRDLIQSLIDDKRKLFKDWEEEDRKNGIRKNNTREYVWIELVKWKMEFFHKWEPNSHRNSIEARNAETELKQAISKAREVADSEPAKFSTLHGYLDILAFYSFILVKDINKLQDDINKRKDDIEKLKREKKAKEKEALQLYQTTKSLCIPWLQLENQYAESYLKNAFDHIMVFHANDFNHMEMVRELEQRISLKLHENDVTWFKMRLAEEYKLSGNLQNAAKTAREVREDPKYAEEASRFLSELIKN